MCVKLGQIKQWSPKFSLSKLHVQKTCCRRMIDETATTEVSDVMSLNPVWGAGTALLDDTGHLILSGQFRLHIYRSDLKRVFSYIWFCQDSSIFIYTKAIWSGCSVTAFRETLTSTAGPTVNLLPAISPYYRHHLLMYTSCTNTRSHSTSIAILCSIHSKSSLLSQFNRCAALKRWVHKNNSTNLPSAHQASTEAVRFWSAL